MRSGSASAPIVIEPDADSEPILDGDAARFDAIRILHSFYVVRGLEIRNMDEGVRVEGVEGVVLEGNHIHHIDNECVRLRHFAVENVVRDNEIHDCGLNGNGEGIYIGTAPEQRSNNGGLPDASTGNLISNNEIFRVTEGIDIKEDSDFNVIEQNHVHDATDPNSGGINTRADRNYFYGNLSERNAGSGLRFGGDVADSPLHGEDYRYGVDNVLRGNIATDNAAYGFKFMNGPQDADCDNTGWGNERSLYHHGAGVAPILDCS